MSDPDRYKSRGRKERTPEQLKVLEMAREKARLVIAERTKIKREMEDPPPPEPEETEPPTPPPEPLAELPAEDSAPEPEETEPPTPPPEPLAVEDPAPPPVEPSMSREEIQTLIHSTLDQRRPPERKYQYINGAYVKIK